MGVAFSQLFPPAATYTETSLPKLDGKIFIVTGGASGIGAELVAMLYNAGGKVYIAGRSEKNARELISRIHQQHPKDLGGGGSIKFLHMDLADLDSVENAAINFARLETRLDVLFNNAGVSLPPVGSISAQSHELMMATNVLGPYLLTQLLLPTLRKTPGARVVWTTSQNAELGAPKGGFAMEKIRNPGADQVYNYNASKIGNQLVSSELARAEPSVLSVVQNPGNVETNLLRHLPAWQRKLASPLLHSAKNGAYTELFAGLSSEVGSGDYVIPWGRRHPRPRADFEAATKRQEEGGSGLSLDFMQWCNERIEGYL